MSFRPTVVRRFVAVSLAWCLIPVSLASAADLTWGVGGAGGAGTWNTSTTNWWNGSGNVLWSSATPDSAIFGGSSGGTVTLGGPITVSNITVNTHNYALSGSTLTLSNTTITANSQLEVVSILDGTTGLTKNGAALMIFWNAMTYTGATVISAGQLTLQGAGAISSSSALQIGSGAVVDLNGFYAPTDINRTFAGLSGAGILYGRGGTVTVNKALGSDTFSGDIQGAQGLIKSGNGTLVLSGANSYTGGTLISGGTLAINGGSVSGGITNNANLSINATLANLVSGTGSLTKTGAAEAYLWSANTYSGATLVNEGQITLGGSGAISTNTLHIASGAAVNLTGAYAAANINRTIGGLTGAGVLYGGGGTVTVSKASGSDTFSGDIQGPQGLIKSGNGTLVLSGTNSYTGGTLISGGTLALNGGSVSGGITNNANLSITADLVNAVSGAGSLTKTGAANAYLWTAMTYTGATVVEGGQLLLGGSGAISTNTTLQIASGAAVNLTGAYADTNINRTIAGLTGAGILYGGGGTVTINKASGSDTFSGDIQGPQGLIKAGSGTLVLSGASSYTGTTSVNVGTLGLHGNSSSPQITVAAGAALNLSVALTATASGTVVFNTGSSVSVSGTPSGESVTLLTASGGITGAPSLVPVAGYSLVTTGNSLILQAATGSTYSAWLGTNAPTPQLLQNYAFGAVSPTNAANSSNLPAYGTTNGQFVLSYSVRMDDSSLVVQPECNADLKIAADWRTNGIAVSVIGTNVVDGIEMEQRQAVVPLTSGKNFLRLKISE